jgi:hypothetical protein
VTPSEINHGCTQIDTDENTTSTLTIDERTIFAYNDNHSWACRKLSAVKMLTLNAGLEEDKNGS